MLNKKNQQNKAEADLLKNENHKIKKEANVLKSEIDKLQKEIQSLRFENENFKKRNEKFNVDIAQSIFTSKDNKILKKSGSLQAHPKIPDICKQKKVVWYNKSPERAKSSYSMVHKSKQNLPDQKDSQFCDEIEVKDKSIIEKEQPQKTLEIDSNKKKLNVSGNKLNDAIQAENNHNYDKAIDLYLSLKPEDCGDENHLDKILERAVKITVKYRQIRTQEVVNIVAQILLEKRRHSSLTKILESIDSYLDAFEIYKAGGMWEDAARLAHYLEPMEQEQFKIEYEQNIYK